jgi:hypothetical protein
MVNCRATQTAGSRPSDGSPTYFHPVGGFNSVGQYTEIGSRRHLRMIRGVPHLRAGSNSTVATKSMDPMMKNN